MPPRLPSLLPATRAASSGFPILLIAEVFPPAIGGSGVLLENVYRRLGQGIAVLTDSNGCAPTAPRREGVAVLRHPWKATRWGLCSPRGCAGYLAEARAIRQAVRGARPALHCARAVPEGLAALIARRGARWPLICWTHGEELAYAETSRELDWLLALVHRHSDAVIANSVNTARLLLARGVAQDRVRTIHPGVQAERFERQAGGARLRLAQGDAEACVLLTVGRLQRRKGQDTVIRALAELKPEMPQLRYWIVGDGEERARLGALACTLGVQDCVHFAGAVPDDMLPDYYAACDIFVMPNRVDEGDFEGFGIVFLEAAAAGKPVIAGRSGGAPEAVADGETGLLVSGPDVGELSSAIRVLATNRARARLMGDRGRERVRREFTWERAADALRALHEEVSASIDFRPRAAEARG